MTAKAVLPKVSAVRRAPCAVRRGMVINHAENYKPKKARFVKLAKKNPPPCEKTTIAALMCAVVLKGDSRFRGNDGRGGNDGRAKW